jgi:PPE-repeat protein
MLRKIAAAAVCCAVFGTTAQAVPSFSFIIDDDTFSNPFSFTNTSDSGENLIRFFIDLTGTGTVFDVVNGGVPNTSNGVPFTPSGGTDVTTGLTGNTVVDGGSTLDLTFNDFAPGESFVFDVDVDFTVGPATVIGNELIGATAFADFSDGQRVSGVFQAIRGNADASGFTATGITLTPPIPLPAPAFLLLGGLGLLAAARRRR